MLLALFITLGLNNKKQILKRSQLSYNATLPLPSCRDRMVVGFTTIYAISAYHHLSCEFEYRSWRGVLNTTLCDKVYQ
jgi:hypothetical protein